MHLLLATLLHLLVVSLVPNRSLVKLSLSEPSRYVVVETPLPEAMIAGAAEISFPSFKDEVRIRASYTMMTLYEKSEKLAELLSGKVEEAKVKSRNFAEGMFLAAAAAEWPSIPCLPDDFSVLLKVHFKGGEEEGQAVITLLNGDQCNTPQQSKFARAALIALKRACKKYPLAEGILQIECFRSPGGLPHMRIR